MEIRPMYLPQILSLFSWGDVTIGSQASLFKENMVSNQQQLFIAVPWCFNLVVTPILLECERFKILLQISLDRKKNYNSTFSYTKASRSIVELSWVMASCFLYWGRNKYQTFFRSIIFIFQTTLLKYNSCLPLVWILVSSFRILQPHFSGLAVY